MLTKRTSDCPTIKNENITAARRAEGEAPVKSANPQIPKIWGWKSPDGNAGYSMDIEKYWTARQVSAIKQ